MISRQGRAETRILIRRCMHASNASVAKLRSYHSDDGTLKSYTACAKSSIKCWYYIVEFYPNDSYFQHEHKPRPNIRASQRIVRSLKKKNIKMLYEKIERKCKG